MDKMSKLVWTNRTTIDFLLFYEQEPCIWSSNDENYKNRGQVENAWHRIVKKFRMQNVDCNVSELKRKKESLMATYRSLLHKIRNSNDTYKPNWFAFETMYKFLPNRTSNMTEDIENIKVEAYSLAEDSNLDDEIEEDAPEPIYSPQNVSIATKTQTSTPRNSKTDFIEHHEIENRFDDNQTFSKTISLLEPEEKDECSLYAELLMKKLRRFDDVNREILMHEIDSLVFKATMKNIHRLPEADGSFQREQCGQSPSQSESYQNQFSGNSNWKRKRNSPDSENRDSQHE